MFRESSEAKLLSLALSCSLNSPSSFAGAPLLLVGE